MSEKPQGKIPVTSLHRDSPFVAKLGGVGFNSPGKVVTLRHKVRWDQVRDLEGDSSPWAKPTVRLLKLENEIKTDPVAKRHDVRMSWGLY